MELEVLSSVGFFPTKAQCYEKRMYLTNCRTYLELAEMLSHHCFEIAFASVLWVARAQSIPDEGGW